jgi:hypothetical protein
LHWCQRRYWALARAHVATQARLEIPVYPACRDCKGLKGRLDFQACPATQVSRDRQESLEHQVSLVHQEHQVCRVCQGSRGH